MLSKKKSLKIHKEPLLLLFIQGCTAGETPAGHFKAGIRSCSHLSPISRTYDSENPLTPAGKHRGSEPPRIAEPAGVQREPPAPPRLSQRCCERARSPGSAARSRGAARPPAPTPCPRRARRGAGRWSCPGSDAARGSPCDAGLARLLHRPPPLAGCHGDSQ